MAVEDKIVEHLSSIVDSKNSLSNLLDQYHLDSTVPFVQYAEQLSGMMASGGTFYLNGLLDGDNVITGYVESR